MRNAHYLKTSLMSYNRSFRLGSFAVWYYASDRKNTENTFRLKAFQIHNVEFNKPFINKILLFIPYDVCIALSNTHTWERLLSGRGFFFHYKGSNLKQSILLFSNVVSFPLRER